MDLLDHRLNNSFAEIFSNLFSLAAHIGWLITAEPRHGTVRYRQREIADYIVQMIAFHCQCLFATKK